MIPQAEQTADVELTQEQQMETARKVAVMNQKALSQMVKLDIRNYLNQLTSPGVDGNLKKQIKESIERAIVFSFDFGINVTNADILQSGKLAKQENAFAAHLVRLRENSMLLLADNMRKQELEQTAASAAEETSNATENV
jgi:hypothetical protein